MQYTVFDDNTCDCKEHPQDERCKSLPVTFMSIIAIKMPGYNIITWDVAMEVNIQYYSVMRSSNGKIYNEIAKVSAKGLSEYKYIDYFKQFCFRCYI